MSGIVVERQRGSAGYLHGLDPFAAGPVESPLVWICAVDAPAIVLGSRQRPELLDLDACARAGLAVVRRRSGGGAVLLRPDAVVWIDLVLPLDAVPVDIRASMTWAGDRWREALIAVGADQTQLEVHRGGMVSSPWSDLVCFAGIGPGEVLAGGRKLVGLSQRRSRLGVRIQGQVHRRGIVGGMPPLFSVDLPVEELPEPALAADVGVLSIDDETLAEALAASVRAVLCSSACRTASSEQTTRM